jgi:hypothetical protein
VAATDETGKAEQADQTGSKTIKPIPQLYNPQNFSNGTAYAAIDPSTIKVNGDGTLTIQAEIYELVRYAANDVENLKPGDDFYGMKVEMIEINEWGAKINGGGPENGTGETYTYGAPEFATLLAQGKLDCLAESCFTKITVKNGLITSIAYTAAV